MRTRDSDEDELEALRRLISADSARLEESDVTRAAERFFGRPDTLELLREVAREEQLLRRLRAEITSGLEQGSGPHRNEQPRVLPIPSLVDGAGRSRGGLAWRRIGLAAAAVLALGVGLNWSAASGLLRAIHRGGSAVPETVATHAAQLDTVNLPDGSRAILAPNSSLRYIMAPLAGPRELRLDGEAFFDVKHDDDRSFRVRTRHAVIEDLGTTFVVREYAEDPRARVTVRSGAATLRPSNGSSASRIDLRPGDGAYIDSSGAIARFTAAPESYGSWTTGHLMFDAAPLPEVLSQLATWYDVEFRMTDSTLTKQYFTGGLNSISLPKALAILGPIVHARFAQEGRIVDVSTRPIGR